MERKVADIKSSSQIVLHTIARASAAILGLSLMVLKHIFKERLPESCDVLDGLIDCTNDNSCHFLGAREDLQVKYVCHNECGGS